MVVLSVFILLEILQNVLISYYLDNIRYYGQKFLEALRNCMYYCFIVVS